ncbi:MAG: hypothetical protein LBH52_01185 [Puniceicoccales bacterium]|jgi:hypothetical protein|nr:hypothetical protein [Puniceicoccales bacterium]
MLDAQILKKTILAFAGKNAIIKAYAGNMLPMGDVLTLHGISYNVGIIFEE